MFVSFQHKDCDLSLQPPWAAPNSLLLEHVSGICWSCWSCQSCWSCWSSWSRAASACRHCLLSSNSVLFIFHAPELSLLLDSLPTALLQLTFGIFYSYRFMRNSLIYLAIAMPAGVSGVVYAVALEHLPR